MKVIQQFFLGGAGGFALALAIAIGLYASPIRKGLYLDWDPEIADLKEKLSRIREKVAVQELGIAEAGPVAAKPADSLKALQAGAWKEYRHWRNRLGELSREHDRPTPAAFASWAYSLRYGLGPLAAATSLLPALLLAWRGARRPSVPRLPRVPKNKSRAGGKPSRSEAMTSLESAVKQVARIAAAGQTPVSGGSTAASRTPAPPARPAPAAPKAPKTATERKDAMPVRPGRESAPEKETEYLPELPRRVAEERPPVPPVPDAFAALESSPYEVPSDNMVFQEPPPNPPLASGGPPRAEGLETQIFQLGPGGWGEARRQAEPPPPERPAAGLSMEDEDAGASPEEEESPGVMPPTTEVERVERRKDEVLKLARKGLTSSEISRRMRISQDQVEFIIRMRREKGSS